MGTHDVAPVKSSKSLIVPDPALANQPRIPEKRGYAMINFTPRLLTSSKHVMQIIHFPRFHESRILGRKLDSVRV